MANSLSPGARASREGASQDGFTRNRLLRPAIALALLAALAAVELAFISFFYDGVGPAAKCGAVAPEALCRLFFHAPVLRILVVIGFLVAFIACKRGLLERLLEGVRRRPSVGAAAVHALGVALLLVPGGVLVGAASPGLYWTLAPLTWLLGGALAASGGALTVFRPAALLSVLRESRGALIIAVALGLAAMDVVYAVGDIWYWQPLTRATTASVEGLLTLLGAGVTVASVPYVDGGVTIMVSEVRLETFAVLILKACAGIEGFFLISTYLAAYIWLFRDQLRLPRAFILVPIGVALSWCLNIVCITALLLIGEHASPELAVDGFHSYAGWLMFSVLALAFTLAAHNVAWFRKPAVAARPSPEPGHAPPPFFQDPTVAMIAPFIVLMGSLLLASTFSQTPGLLYPLRAAAMAAALVAFWPVLSRLDLRVAPSSVLAGVLVGVAWVAVSPERDAADGALSAALAQLGPAAFAVWVGARVLGTSVLVPIIEELFFRGYILRRLDVGGLWMRAAAILVSSGLFAALHDRWLEAFVAGVVFAAVHLRHGRLSDPIAAHAAANIVIAGWAVSSGDFSVI